MLELAVSHYLFEMLPGRSPGDYTKLRATAVNRNSVGRVARRIEIAPLIRLGKGEEAGGGRKRLALLADCMEAVIGAVYLDAGFVAAQALVQRLFKDVEITPHMDAIGKDAKTELQEWLQGRKMKLPAYKVVGTIGAAHKQSFDVECEISEFNLTERGIGGSRRAGEQAAAAAMLQTLKARAKP